MTNIFERAWAEINLDNIAHNVGETKRIVSDKTKVMAVVKADAYGHGFLEVSKTLIESGIDYLAVALPSEATQLRKRSINVPILVLGYTSYKLIDELIDLDITLTVFDYSFAEAISRISKAKNKTAKFHFKIDT